MVNRIIPADEHVTNGGFNLVLTMMALAFRAAERLVQTW